jgi:hypothetical protein
MLFSPVGCLVEKSCAKGYSWGENVRTVLLVRARFQMGEFSDRSIWVTPGEGQHGDDGCHGTVSCHVCRKATDTHRSSVGRIAVLICKGHQQAIRGFWGSANDGPVRLVMLH